MSTFTFRIKVDFSELLHCEQRHQPITIIVQNSFPHQQCQQRLNVNLNHITNKVKSEFIYIAHLKQPHLTKVLHKLNIQFKISSKCE